MYDPKSYWESRGGPAYMETIHVADYKEHWDAQEAFIRERVLSLDPKTLLDFGCGTGKLFHLWDGISFTAAYDISHSMLKEARKTIAELGDGYKGQLSLYAPLPSRNGRLDFPDKMFEAVVACEVLAHVLPDDIKVTIMELHRLIKPGGTMAIVTAAPFGQGAAHNFDYNYSILLSEWFDVTYDVLREPYRHIVAVKRDD